MPHPWNPGQVGRGSGQPALVADVPAGGWTRWHLKAPSNSTHSMILLLKRRENTYPAKALHADVICVGAAGRPIDDTISQLVIRRVSRHAAEQLAPILHQNWGWEGGEPEVHYPHAITSSW